MAKCNTVQSIENVKRDCATWPPEQQARWIAAFAPESGPPRWARQTQYQNGGVYTRYLACVAGVGMAPAPSGPGLRAYVAQCAAGGACPRTIAGYLWSIYKAALVVLPDEELSWLSNSCQRADAVADRTAKKKNSQVAPAEEILEFGLSLVAEARRVGPTSWSAIQTYRDGLFLAFGIVGPERLRALAGLARSDVDLESGLAVFGPAATKTRVTSVRTYPELVLELMREWIASWRSELYEPAHDCVWIAKGGQAPCPEALYAAMRKRTLSAPWGYSITPHRLRDAAATFLTQSSPSDARLAQFVLNHASEEMTREYTETAVRFEASRRGRELISLCGRALEKPVRASTSSTIALNPRSRRRHRR